MATIVNNPPSGDSGGGMGAAMAMILVMAIVLIFFIYGLPALRSSGAGNGPTVNIPDKVDINVNQPSTQNK